MSNQRIIQKVVPLLLQLEKNNDEYFPEAVSLGPYHHGEPKLAFVEAFKPVAVNLFVAGGQQAEEAYYNIVFGIVGEIRNCYEPASTVNYSDDDLAQMMLRDASLIVIYMEIAASDTRHPEEETVIKIIIMMEHLGLLIFESLSRDLNLLQNQIPLRVIKLLIDLRYGEGRGTGLIDRFIHKSHFGIYRQERESNYLQPTREPLHLLEAIHEALISVGRSRRGGAAEAANEPNNTRTKSIPKYRAATDLKAKGIYLRPSPSFSVNDVSFKSCLFNAWLELPVCGVSPISKVLYKNMVAYELSPNSPAKGEISSYIYFMNSLIEKPDDVKELREREILYNMLGSDDEVLNVFKDINTHGAGISRKFQQVRDQINAHSNSRIKTWMAQLIHTNFKYPWTVLAVSAALALLALSAARKY